jgi:hypothetical protein
MKKISEPENDIRKFEDEEEKYNGFSPLFLLVLILSISLDMYDIIPLILLPFPGIETLMSLIVSPIEGLSTLAFWLYSKEKAKKAKFLVNLLRSSYFIEMISDLLPELGRIIDLLPLRSLALFLLILLSRGEEMIKKPFKTIE